MTKKQFMEKTGMTACKITVKTWSSIYDKYDKNYHRKIYINNDNQKLLFGETMCYLKNRTPMSEVGDFLYKKYQNKKGYGAPIPGELDL